MQIVSKFQFQSGKMLWKDRLNFWSWYTPGERSWKAFRNYINSNSESDSTWIILLNTNTS